MHLQLSEKYMTYKDLADRCLINTQHIDKGDKRVFYLKPQSIFLEEPRKQNQYRNEFVKMVSTPPAPEPLTLFADDLHRDKSNPSLTKSELALFFKRRQYKLQHKKYKLLQRWAHYALTSELVDKVSLKFSPTYSKLQFELENAVKRQQRLEGEDHFLNTSSRPQTINKSDSGFNEDKSSPLSTLRIDDIDVYLRVACYEEKINRDCEKLIERVKWAPMSHRFEILQQSLEYFQDVRNDNLEKQRVFAQAIEDKGQALISFKKLGAQGQKDLQQIMNSQHVRKLDKRCENLREKYLQTCKYNYEQPKLVVWNDIELKLQLLEKASPFGIHGDLEIDNGHSFAYSIMVFFPTYFQTQVIKSQFVLYDAVPALIDPTTLAKKNIRLVLDRNRKRYGNTTTGQNTLLEKLEIKAKEEQLQTEYINSVEKALFGEFNSGQIKDFPSVRVKQSTWVTFICFQAVLNNDQKYQAAILANENNPIDECLKLSLDLVNVQDVTNSNLILESLSQIHHDKVKHGQIKSEFLLQNAFASEQDIVDRIDTEQVFTENERSFLSIFKGCLKTKSEFESKPLVHIDQNENPSQLLQVTQHLLFSLYLLKCLRTRDSKIKLLYTLNAFRAVQKRLVLELREMGTRDRVMGDSQYLGPMETMTTNSSSVEIKDDNPERDQIVPPTSHAKFNESSYSQMYKPNRLQESENPKIMNKIFPHKAKSNQLPDPNENDPDAVDVINGQLIDIHQYRFNDKFQNFVFSTCPIIPRFHSTFGEPLERQEISAELENNSKPDNKKEEGLKLMGRVDEIYLDEKTGYYLVKDDFGVHIMFDAAFLDMKNLEQEALKICSYYIQKQEPLTDQDLRYIFPSVDRFQILDDLFACEQQYHNAKLELVLVYLECFEHLTDLLEQQRMIQIIVDLMAQRPRLNLNGTHFKDSYKAECQSLEIQTQIIREVVRMQMKNEFEQNNFIREYLERTYRLIMEQVENKFQYQRPETLDQEIKARENLQKGIMDESINHNDNTTDDALQQKDSIQTQDSNLEKARRNSIEQQQQDKKTQVFSAKFSDPKEFANYLGIPFASLQMLMKDYKERDPLVKQSIHEHVSIEEGYPSFMYDMSMKQNNTLAFTKQSQRIGILDFYESLHIIVKVIAAMQGAFQELNEVHRPDNGFMTTALEISSYRFFLAELKMIKGENQLIITPPAGLNYLEDDSILGNPDKMLFYTKEFLATAEDEQSSHNPYLLTKLNLKTIENFSFDAFQKILLENSNTASSAGLFQEAMRGKRKITTHHAYRFFPKLKARAQKVFIPSMLYLTCNSIEMLRLRHILIKAVLQKKLLEEVYEKQVKLIGKDGRIYFKDPFNFENFIQLGEKGYMNFVDEGPASGIEIDLAINEFDPSLRSHINFSDPDSFKSMICPMGLEEFRAVVFYELMNLQTLIVATRTNQLLLDNTQRHLCELEVFSKGFVVANPVFDYYIKLSGHNLLEPNLRKLHISERSLLLSKLNQSVGEIYYNIISKKNRMKNFVEKHFQKCRQDITAGPLQKSEIQLRKLRTFRVSLCQDYCLDVLAEVYSDAIKFQMMNDCDQIRKRAFLIPKESLFFEIGTSEYGEYESVNYRYESNSTVKFLDKSKRKIKRFWKIPSNKEITKFNTTYDQIRQQDLKFIFQLDKSDKDGGLTPNFHKNNQHKLVKSRLPKLQFIRDQSELDLYVREKKRFVNFTPAFTYEYIQPSLIQQSKPSDQQSPHLLSILAYFKNILNLFDLELFQNKIGSKSQSIASLEKCVLSSLPFWEEGDEALLNGMTEGDGTEVNSPREVTDRSVIANVGYKNNLASIIVERMGLEKKNKLKLHQELESIKDKFSEIENIMSKLELNEDIDKASQYIQEQVHLSYYGIISSLFQIQDFYLKETSMNARKELLVFNDFLKTLGHFDHAKITYNNGFHVNLANTHTQSLNIDDAHPTLQDFGVWQLAAQPIIDENALAPTQFTLIHSMFTSQNRHQSLRQGRYMGCLRARDYQELDFSLVNLNQSVRKYCYSNFISVDNQLKEYLKIKFNHEDQYFAGNVNQYFDFIAEKKLYLKTILKSKQLRRVVLVLLGNSPVPMELDDYQKLAQTFQEDVQWKINAKWDDQQITRIKKQEKETLRRSQQKDVQTINNALKKQQEQMSSNVLTQLELAMVEIEVLSNEVQRFLINAAFKMMSMETAALSRAFEVNGKHFEFYIHPCQQFASTRDQKVDKRNHLDIINKVSVAQKFLTQVKNRCLEIETITSGVGLVISQKDLNECLEEACRALIKTHEVEMRTRCETFALQQCQYENLIYIKDRQLLNMEEKLKQAKKEIDKIIRTKVFSKGNQLVYELDTSTRQLRLIKDNVFEMEKKLSDKIRLEFDRELDQRGMELDECRKRFSEFQMDVNARVMADVRDNVNNIDALMKSKAEMFKDLSKNAVAPNNSNQMTINIGSLTIKNVSSSTQQNAGLVSMATSVDQNSRALKEYERLKQSEKEAREEIIKLQEIMRKQRIFDRFKTVLMRQQFEHKLDNLRDQLNSNMLLWEQLAEGEKREKILKRELEQSQQEIVTQEKVIEQLKDELKKERGDKQKLIQYKQTKAKRLEELEGKAREFEVLHNLNLPKVLNLLESKEDKILALKSKEKLQDAQISQMQRLKTLEMQQMQKKYEQEMRVKSEAMGKLESLRHELSLIEGQDQSAVEAWKDKCRKLIEICKSFKDENDRLMVQQMMSQGGSISGGGGGIAESDGAESGGINTVRLQYQTNYRNKTSSIIREEAREDHEQSAIGHNTQTKITKQNTVTSNADNNQKSSGKNSSRFKLKKEIGQQQQYSASYYQQQVNQMNQSLDNPYSGPQVNMSMVLAGNGGAYTGTSLGPAVNNTSDRMNQSFVEQSRGGRDNSTIELPQIHGNARKQHLAQYRGKSTNEISQIAKQKVNIFSGKPQQQINNTIDKDQAAQSPPKTPIMRGYQQQLQQQQYEFESHSSSIYGKLTPVYDPKMAFTTNQKMKLQQKSAIQDKSDNVFSSLTMQQPQKQHVMISQFEPNERSSQDNQISQMRQRGIETQLIGSLGGGVGINNQSRNMKIISASNSIVVPQSSVGIGSNSQLLQLSQSQFNAQQYASQNSSHQMNPARNYINQNLSTITDIRDTSTTQQTTQTNSRNINNATTVGGTVTEKYHSTSVVRTKMISPPRALTKELDRQGLKGGIIKKQINMQLQE